MSLSGSKSKSKSTETINQTQNNTLSDRAAGMLTGGITDLQGRSYKAFDPSTIGQYESPYQEDVINATLNQADQRDAVAWNGVQDGLARSGAFGDKRRGIVEAETTAAQSRDRASLIAGMRDKNFSDARDVAQGENQNANQFELALQQLITQLRGGFGNEGTQQVNGTNTGKSSNSNLGFSFKYGG